MSDLTQLRMPLFTLSALVIGSMMGAGIASRLRS